MSATAGPATVESIDPANGELVETYEVFTEGQIDAALDLSHGAFRTYSRSPWSERSALMSAVAREMRAMGDEFAKTVSREMGKPLKEAEAEVEKCAWAADHYAEHGERYLAPEPVDAGEGRRVTVYKRPLGPVLAIMPWNYPLWQAMRAATPIVSAGNTFVLKHASNVTGCALLLEQAFERAGAAPGVFKTIVVSGRKASELIGDRRISAVTLTGSDAAGVAVGEAAGRAIKPVVLELGGSDPFIVLHDANLEKAVEVGGHRALPEHRPELHRGEAVHRRRGGRRRVRAALRRGGEGPAPRRAVRPRDPARPDGPRGPARRARRDRPRLRVGGRQASSPAARPLTSPVPGTSRRWSARRPTRTPRCCAKRPSARSPRWSASPTRTAAIELANDSEFGLGSSVWTEDLERAEKLSAGIEAGMVFVNAMTASDPRIPFGGVKRSGIGRELGGEFGIRAFVNMQAVALTEL